MTTLDQFAASKLTALDTASLRRTIRPTTRHADAAVTRDGKRLISFSCNDYLNLSTHPAVIAASVAATQEYGTGAGASRLVTGNHPLYRALETRLAALKATEDGVVFGSGYLANIGIIPTLAGVQDAIFIDQLAHACLWAGAKLSGAAVYPFEHNNVTDLDRLLTAHAARHRLILTDGVFSMDGDRAPIATLAICAATHNAWLMTDDAHGIGVLNEGRGSAHGTNVPLQMGTLSKAVGSYGGYLCASRVVCDLIRNRARSLIYTTGLPPGVIAAASAALDIIAADPALCAKPLENAQFFTTALQMPQAQSPIVPLILGTAEAALAAQARLDAAGFLVTAIRPPTVPANTARLRFAFTASHQQADIRQVADMVRDLRAAYAPALFAETRI